jgi:hypothetical protein
MLAIKQKKKVKHNTLTISLPDEYKNHNVEVIVMMDDELEYNKNNNDLKKSANLLLEDYKNNSELTSFTSIDGDNFYE